MRLDATVESLRMLVRLQDWWHWKSGRGVLCGDQRIQWQKVDEQVSRYQMSCRIFDDMCRLIQQEAS